MPTVVMISGTSMVIDRSPYMTRTGFTLGQSSGVLGSWAAANGYKKVVTLVSIRPRVRKPRLPSRRAS